MKIKVIIGLLKHAKICNHSSIYFQITTKIPIFFSFVLVRDSLIDGGIVKRRYL